MTGVAFAAEARHYPPPQKKGAALPSTPTGNRERSMDWQALLMFVTGGVFVFAFRYTQLYGRYVFTPALIALGIATMPWAAWLSADDRAREREYVACLEGAATNLDLAQLKSCADLPRAEPRRRDLPMFILAGGLLVLVLALVLSQLVYRSENENPEDDDPEDRER